MGFSLTGAEAERANRGLRGIFVIKRGFGPEHFSSGVRECRVKRRGKYEKGQRSDGAVREPGFQVAHGAVIGAESENIDYSQEGEVDLARKSRAGERDLAEAAEHNLDQQYRGGDSVSQVEQGEGRTEAGELHRRHEQEQRQNGADQRPLAGGSEIRLRAGDFAELESPVRAELCREVEGGAQARAQDAGEGERQDQEPQRVVAEGHHREGGAESADRCQEMTWLQSAL